MPQRRSHPPPVSGGLVQGPATRLRLLAPEFCLPRGPELPSLPRGGVRQARGGRAAPAETAGRRGRRAARLPPAPLPAGEVSPDAADLGRGSPGFPLAHAPGSLRLPGFSPRLSKPAVPRTPPAERSQLVGGARPRPKSVINSCWGDRLHRGGPFVCLSVCLSGGDRPSVQGPPGTHVPVVVKGELHVVVSVGTEGASRRRSGYREAWGREISSQNQPWSDPLGVSPPGSTERSRPGQRGAVQCGQARLRESVCSKGCGCIPRGVTAEILTEPPQPPRCSLKGERGPAASWGGPVLADSALFRQLLDGM